MTRHSVLVGVLAVLLAASAPPAGFSPAQAALPDADQAQAKVEQAQVEQALDEVDERIPKWAVGTACGGFLPKMAVSPTSDRVFLAGGSGTCAYDAATGELLWEVPRTAPGYTFFSVADLAVSPDGERVYAVGSGRPEGTPNVPFGASDILVAAYDAATGAALWRRATGFDGLDENNDRYLSREVGRAIVVSPDGRRVYVTGGTTLRDRIAGQGGQDVTLEDVLVVAYDAVTGRQRWLTQWGDKYELYSGRYIAVSPDSERVYVGGTVAVPPTTFFQDGASDFLALGISAYNPAAPQQEGQVLWESHYEGLGGRDEPVSMGLAPDGSRLYLTGRSAGGSGKGGDWDWATVAFLTGTGEQAWASRYEGARGQPHELLPVVDEQVADESHQTASMAVSPTGDAVFVTGLTTTFAWMPGRDLDANDIPNLRYSAVATVAYDAVTGQQQDVWVLQHSVPPAGLASRGNAGSAVTVSPDGKVAYVVGSLSEMTVPTDDPDPEEPTEERWEQVTTAYDTATGDRIWIARTPDLRNPSLRAFAWVEASRDGESLFSLSTNWNLETYDAVP